MFGSADCVGSLVSTLAKDSQCSPSDGPTEAHSVESQFKLTVAKVFTGDVG